MGVRGRKDGVVGERDGKREGGSEREWVCGFVWGVWVRVRMCACMSLCV